MQYVLPAAGKIIHNGFIVVGWVVDLEYNDEFFTTVRAVLASGELVDGGDIDTPKEWFDSYWDQFEQSEQAAEPEKQAVK